MFVKVALVLGCCIALASGQVISLGKCPEVQTEQNFDVARYTGLWYEIKRFEAIFQLGGECVTAQYDALDNGTVKVTNTLRNKLGLTQSIVGNAREVNPSTHDGKLKVIFPSVPAPEGDYWVLGTDYDNYSVVWACGSLSNIANYQFAWVLSRTPTLSAQSEQNVNDILTANKIVQKHFRTTRQDATFCKRT